MIEVPPPPALPATSPVEIPGRFNLVANYGRFWSRAELERPGKKRMAGRLDAGRPANFWGQEAVYVLLKGTSVHYVGISRVNGQRLHDHTLDDLKHDWDTFHWFGFQPVSQSVDDDGLLLLEPRVKRVEIKTKSVRQDIEAILGRSFPMPGMKANPLFGAAGVKKWMQMSRNDIRAYRDSWAVAHAGTNNS